jgi:hypothetical protein
MEVEKRDQLVVVHTYIGYHRQKMEVEKWDQPERWKLRNGISLYLAPHYIQKVII